MNEWSEWEYSQDGDRGVSWRWKWKEDTSGYSRVKIYQVRWANGEMLGDIELSTRDLIVLAHAPQSMKDEMQLHGKMLQNPD